MIYLLPLAYGLVNRKIAMAAILLTGVSWVGVVSSYAGEPLPLIQSKMTDIECGQSLLVFSEMERPQLQDIYPKAEFIGPQNVAVIGAEIKEELAAGREVCVSRQAWNYPYRQYDGQLKHPLPGRRGTKGELEQILPNAERIKVTEDKRYPYLGEDQLLLK